MINELKAELKRKEAKLTEINKSYGLIPTLKRQIEELQWKIEELEPTISLVIKYKAVEPLGKYFLVVDKTECVTRKNAAQFIEELEKQISEKNLMKQNDHLNENIEKIRKLFNIWEKWPSD